MIEYIYDGYGNLLNKDEVLNNTIAKENPFIYKGYYYDFETGLYYCNSRYYNPEWGRFISADDVSYLDPSSINGLNLYVYCGNNPVMYSDSTRHAPEYLKWLSIGAAVLGAVLVVGAITVLTMGVGTTIMATTMAGVCFIAQL